jgi:hypothetical protein
MKRFILKTLLTFILPMALLLGAVEITFRSVNNDYKLKHHYMGQYADSLKVLSLGSSHAHFGINPAYFSVPAFNLAMPSQSLKYDWFLFEKWAPQCPNLTHVILPISYFSLFYHLEDKVMWTYAKGYHIYMGCTYHAYQPIYHLELMSKEKWLGLVKNIGQKLDFTTCNELGFGYKRQHGLRKPHWQEEAIEAISRHTKADTTHLHSNTSYIRNILTYCQEKGIQVLLLTPPTHPDYYTHLDSTQWNTTVRICQQFCKEFTNTTYLNWLKDSTFVEEDFYDADHVNRIGAVKLSSKLNKIIQLTE